MTIGALIFPACDARQATASRAAGQKVKWPAPSVRRSGWHSYRSIPREKPERAQAAVLEFVRRRRVQTEQRNDPQEALPGFRPQPHRSFRAPLEHDIAVRILWSVDPGQRADAFLGMVGQGRQNGPVAGPRGAAMALSLRQDRACAPAVGAGGRHA